MDDRARMVLEHVTRTLKNRLQDTGGACAMVKGQIELYAGQSRGAEATRLGALHRQIEATLLEMYELYHKLNTFELQSGRRKRREGR